MFRAATVRPIDLPEILKSGDGLNPAAFVIPYYA
jgi:hypothetical protein